MEYTLNILFNFLIENRSYNKNLQERFYKTVIKPYDDLQEKIVALLYNIANTQSKPKIDNLALFYKNTYHKIESLNSFESFVKYINPSGDLNYKSLYEGMKNQPGWGRKTAALFTKTIFHLHNGHYDENLLLWSDAPKILTNTDKLYLPVDSVIISIFKAIEPAIKWDFDNVNKQLSKYYSGSDIEVWDDLWFWGFITQIGSGDNRKFGWNLNKYWSIKDSSKDENIITEIKTKSQRFLALIEPK